MKKFNKIASTAVLVLLASASMAHAEGSFKSKVKLSNIKALSDEVTDGECQRVMKDFTTMENSKHVVQGSVKVSQFYTIRNIVNIQMVRTGKSVLAVRKGESEIKLGRRVLSTPTYTFFTGDERGGEGIIMNDFCTAFGKVGIQR